MWDPKSDQIMGTNTNSVVKAKVNKPWISSSHHFVTCFTSSAWCTNFNYFTCFTSSISFTCWSENTSLDVLIITWYITCFFAVRCISQPKERGERDEKLLWVVNRVKRFLSPVLPPSWMSSTELDRHPKTIENCISVAARFTAAIGGPFAFRSDQLNFLIS